MLNVIRQYVENCKYYEQDGWERERGCGGGGGEKQIGSILGKQDIK